MSRIGQCFNTSLLTGVDVIPVNVYVTVSVGPRLLMPEPQSVTWNQNISNKVVNNIMLCNKAYFEQIVHHQRGQL